MTLAYTEYASDLWSISTRFKVVMMGVTYSSSCNCCTMPSHRAKKAFRARTYFANSRFVRRVLRTHLAAEGSCPTPSEVSASC